MGRNLEYPPLLCLRFRGGYTIHMVGRSARVQGVRKKEYRKPPKLTHRESDSPLPSTRPPDKVILQQRGKKKLKKTTLALLLSLLLALLLHGGLSLIGMVPREVAEANNYMVAFARGILVNKDTVIVDHDSSPVSAYGHRSEDGAFSSESGIYPDSIRIGRIGVDSPIVFPGSTYVDELDAALAEGVVYYPGSGRLDENGNIFLFGHTSRLKHVYNPAYKAFNGVEDLTVGDTISLVSDGTEYTYQVRSVKWVDEESELVSLASEKRLLTLSTCTTFGKREDRIIVEAEFIETAPLKETVDNSI